CALGRATAATSSNTDDHTVKPLSVVRYFPMASKFSSGNPSGSMNLWHTAHESTVMWTSSRWRLVIGVFVGRSTTAVLTSGGGGGIDRHINDSRMNFPRSVG